MVILIATGGAGIEKMDICPLCSEVFIVGFAYEVFMCIPTGGEL
jgi:hypothetical protein